MKTIKTLVFGWAALAQLGAFATVGNYEALRIQVGTIEGVNFRRDCHIQVCVDKDGNVTTRKLENKLSFHNDSVVKSEATSVSVDTAKKVSDLISMVRGIPEPHFPSNNRLLRNYWIKDMNSSAYRLLSTSIREVGKSPIFLKDDSPEGLALIQAIDEVCN